MPTTIIDTASATVVATTLIGTDITIVTAWEHLAGHSSIRAGDDYRLGEITARPLPAHIEAMTPGSAERIEACVDFAAGNVLDAYQAIGEAYPWLLERDDILFDRGRVEVHGDPAAQPCTSGCSSYVVACSLGLAWCGTVDCAAVEQAELRAERMGGRI